MRMIWITMEHSMHLVVFLVILSGCIADNRNCTEENVDFCMEPMKKFELDEYTAIVPVFDEASLNIMCNDYIKTENCMKDFISLCSVVDKFYFSAVEKSWDYICNDTKKEYLQIRNCLTTPGLHSAGDKCSEQWKGRSEHVSNNSLLYNQKDKTNLICSYANTYLECVYTEVHRFCGEQSAEWQKGFDDVLIQPILRLIGCKKEGDVYYYPGESVYEEKVSKTTLIIIAVSIFSGITIMVLIALILLRTRKRPRSGHLFYLRSSHRPSVVGGAEPYPEPNPDGSVPYMIYPSDGTAISGPPVPPPYLEKDAPPPSYQGAPENATGGSDEAYSQEKQEKASTHKSKYKIKSPNATLKSRES